MKKRAFKYFISYAGIDDKPRHDQPHGQHGWVTHLARDLKDAFVREAGCKSEDVFGYFNPESTDLGPFPDNLRLHAETSDALVVVASPSFHAREWCKFEIDHFIEGRKKAGEAEVAKRRFLIASLANDALDALRHKNMHPALANQQKCIHFWQKDLHGNSFLICAPVPHPNHPQRGDFDKAVTQLARLMHGVAEVVWELPPVDEKAPTATQIILSPFQTSISKRVFVDGMPEDSDKIEQVRTALVGAGFVGPLRLASSSAESRHSSPAGDFLELITRGDIYLLVRYSADARSTLNRLRQAVKGSMSLEGKQLFFANLRARVDPIDLGALSRNVTDLSKPGQNEAALAKRLKALQSAAEG